MRIIYSGKHHLHAPPSEFTQGRLVPFHEIPARADIVLQSLKNASFTEVIEPSSFSKDKILAVHAAGMVDLIENGYKDWEALGRDGSAFPSSWPLHLQAPLVTAPEHIDGRLAYYCADTATPLTKTSWPAIKASVDCALTGADFILRGDSAMFSLCRPPGHHSAAASFGGFCFLNNAAIAAQHLLDQGFKKIAILDIDYHHGNGTQDIFYRRKDVLTVSIHADPLHEYPFFWGHADERGEGEGLGFNLNLPLPLGAEWSMWSEALTVALEKIKAFSADVLLIGLGVDTYKDDPISLFRLGSSCYPQIGDRIASLGLPSLFVMEGGYAVHEIGTNVVGVLTGFMNKNQFTARAKK